MFGTQGWAPKWRGLWPSACSIALLGMCLPAVAAGGRHAALVVDGNSGRILSESAADEQRYPASLTKMMTLYVIFELIEQRKLSYETRITFSDAATRVPPTKLGVAAGESITVLEAAKALITKSANDASVALAEHVAGSQAQFAQLMTQTARRIGMKATTFKNAHGLPDNGQVTTARDMVTLGLRLQDDFPRHYPLFATREFTYRGDAHRNHNTMLSHYEGTDGIKTGYIGASGFNLVANVKRDGKHVIGAVFGGSTAGARNATMRSLLTAALAKASTEKTRTAKPTARNAPTPIKVPVPVAITRPVPPAAPALVAQAPALATQLASPPQTQPSIDVARVKAVAVVVRQPAPQAAALVPPIVATPRPPVIAALPPGASRLAGPAPAAAAGNGIHIQVGAYNSKAEADRRLADVQSQAGTLLANYPAQAQQAVASGKTVFRARFVNVDPSSAGNVCNALRRHNIDCLVAKPE